MDEMLAVLRRVRRAIELLGGGGHDGEDLYSEVRLACLQKMDYDWSHPKIEGRVMHIARNLRATQLRRQRLPRHVSLPSDDSSILPVAECGGSQFDSTVCACCRTAVDALPERYRRIIYERYYEGKRLEAIARELHMPSATVRTRCHRALKQLAQRIGGDVYDEGH